MCGVKRFMLNKNLFKRFSLLAFVMFFCFVLVSPICLASNPNGKTPNGYTPVNDHISTTDEETNNRDSNLAENNNQSGNADEEEEEEDTPELNEDDYYLSKER